jgi:hypothetical protein
MSIQKSSIQFLLHNLMLCKLTVGRALSVMHVTDIWLGIFSTFSATKKHAKAACMQAERAG